mgnify:CR=1 FL=1
MKKILLVFAAVWITVSGNAQVTADIGIWGGSSVYFGDIDESNPFQPLNLNYGGYFRYNFNARVGLKYIFYQFQQFFTISATRKMTLTLTVSTPPPIRSKEFSVASFKLSVPE